MCKRISALLLACILVLSLLPGVRAAGGILASGTAGENITWTLTEDYHLSLTGTGPMDDYTSSSAPWDSYSNRLTSVELSEGITTVGSCSFYCAYKLSEAKLPSTLTAIHEDAFYNCMDLTSVDLSDSITEIGDGAFSHCSDLVDFQLPKNLRIIGSGAFYNTLATSAIIPDGVTSIGQNAFYICPLEEVYVPASVEALDCLTFGNAAPLTFITVSPENPHYCNDEQGALYTKDMTTLLTCPGGYSGSFVIPDGVSTISSSAFAYCGALTEVTMPDTVTQIGGSLFSNCENLTRIDLSQSITEISDGMFFYCEALEQINIPETVTFIGDLAFGRCCALEEVVIPDSVTLIEDKAFSYCTGLTRVTLGSGLEELQYEAFRKCTALTEITFRGSAPAFTHYAYGKSDDAFDGVTATVYYPGCDPTWTEEARSQAGGTLTWVAQDSHSWRGATCTEPRKCTGCGITEGEALGHDWLGLDCRRCDAHRENPFTDTDPLAFYFDSVLWAVENGITTGTTPTTFSPLGQCQRAQVVTFLWRAAGKPEPVSTENPFADVKESDFFHKAVLWAVEKGITNGISATEFGSYRPCSRAQVVTFLWRSAGCPAAQAENPFTDVKAGDFYYEAVLWALENGITNGISATEFGVNTACNRAQIVTFLCRAFA